MAVVTNYMPCEGVRALEESHPVREPAVNFAAGRHGMKPLHLNRGSCAWDGRLGVVRWVGPCIMPP